MHLSVFLKGFSAARDANLFLVTAIANYTSRVVSKTLSAEQTQEALKFLGQFDFDFDFRKISF